jgi:hypothetical protein
MLKDTIAKNELIKLLDIGNEIDREVFKKFSGESFQSSNDEIKIEGLRKTFDLLIPRSTWTKEDFILNYEDLSVLGIDKDKRNTNQLIIEIKGVEKSFITTSDAVAQLFTPMKMNTYANYLLDGDDEHFDLMIINYKYWFYQKRAEEKLRVRTVVEDGSYIVRCFATPSYQPIDNNVLLYMAVWGLDQLNVKFRISNVRIDHSSMALDFLSEETIIIPDVGELNYGFSVYNSETKEKTVQFHPACELTNHDGTKAVMIFDRPISIPHRGGSFEPILGKLSQLKELRSQAEYAANLIKLTEKIQVNEFLAYKIQNAIIQVIGKQAFAEYAEKYTQLSSQNTYNLLEFFGRLNDIPVHDDDKKVEIQRLFWKFLNDEYHKSK